MKRLFANLCSQLDALSNYHFAPRPVADEADVHNCEDVLAIAMEEVLPLHVSRSRGIAPEEVHAAGKGRKSVLKGESELDQVSADLLHRSFLIFLYLDTLSSSDALQRLTTITITTKASARRQEVGTPKGTAAKARRQYQTSTKFFAKMQENVDSIIHGGAGKGNEREKKKRKELEAGQASSVYRL